MSLLIGVLPLAAILAAPCMLLLTGRRPHPGWVAAAVPAALLGLLARLAPPVLSGEVLRVSLPWFPDLGVRYALTLDGLALLFCGLITGAGVLILVYSAAYMRRGGELARFYAYMLLFMGAMLGVVMADDLVLLYVFWELTSLASFFLIGYKNEDPAARAGAVHALVVTVAGGVVMLAGFVLLAQAGGTWQISGLAAKSGAIIADGRYPAILILILVGAFTKSAQIPFHFWLPGAMVAPTPVSTYLHSATMVWAGVYLLARLLPVLGGTSLWTGVITPVGLGTLLVGTGLAVAQTDLKALLAYSTIGALGLVTALIGWGTAGAAAAAMAYMLNHAAFKGALFLVAGAVEHETGTRQIDRLGALGRRMPVTMGIAAAATLSMAALPPFGGFLSKEAAVDVFLSGSWPAAGLVILSGALSVAYGARFMWVFFGKSPANAPGRRQKRAKGETPERPPDAVHEPPILLWAPPAVLAALALIFGVAPAGVERLAGLAASAMTGDLVAAHLWHGVTVKVAAVTGAALAVGAVFVARQEHARNLASSLPWISAGRLYESLYTGTLQGAKALTGLYMTGRLRDYLVYILVTTVALVAYGLARTGAHLPLTPAGLGPGEALSVLVAMAAAVAAVRLRLLLGSILALGVAGYSVSLIYLLLSAPDIAVTQAVIETISLVLFIIALSALSKVEDGSSPRRPAADAVVALATGGLAAVLALMVSDLSPLPRIADSFFANAAKAGGTNVVNLVIVDFRGWDTMGEISVLAIAALGIMAMAPWRTNGAPVTSGAVGDPPMTTVILRTVSHIAFPIIILFALRLWWTGHYGPGGGFVGGLMVAAAISLQAMTQGAGLLARRWDWLMASGLLLAVGSGIVPLAAGAPALQHTVVYLGSVKLASSLIFDMGVLLLVTGTVMAAVRSLVEAA